MLKPKFENKPKIKSGTKRTVPLVPKSLVPILLIISMILPLFGPVGVFAQAGNTITYTYKAGIGNEQELESVFMRINTNINTVGTHDITVLIDGDRPENIGKVTIEERDLGKDIYRNFWINNPKTNMRITSIIIGDFQLNFEPLAKINRMETYDINTGDIVSFTGERLDYYGTEIHISGENGPFYANETGRFTQQMNGTTGYKNISLKMDNGEIAQIATYPKAFKLLGNIPLLGDVLEIIPKAGSNESIAYIKAENGRFTTKDGEPMYSVFFLSDATDKYSEKNMAEIISASSTGNVIKIKVPKGHERDKEGKITHEGLDDSKYYDVVITNKVDPKKNIYEQILETKKTESRFFVIGADQGPVLTRIDPKKGPDTGETVQITGRNFDEVAYIDGIENPQDIKVNEVKIEPNKTLDDILEGIIDTELENVDKKPESVFHLKYKDFSDSTYNNVGISKIDRYIATYIGNRTTPAETDGKPQYRFSSYLDNISVNVPPAHVDKETVVNVILIMQTEIRTNDGTVHKVIDIITNDGVKYTIVPSHTAPSINKIIPEKIQVVEDRSDGKYGLKEDMVIGIEGENFKVIRTKDQDTKKDITNYPIIGLGANLVNSEEGIVLRLNPEKEGQVEIYKNENWEELSGADMTVLDPRGNIIDGTVGKDTGNKILITLPKTAGIRLPRESVTTDAKNPVPKPVFVMNPVLGSKEPGYPVSNDNVSLMFVDLQDSLSPTIDQVSPNVVAIDSGEEITVTGSNFQQGIRVFVGGVEVTGVKHELDPSGLNTILKFSAPKFPQIVEGPTKLMVMNPDGGQATKDFTYVKSLQRDPSLMGFSPKSGTLGTVVIVDGDNFLAPNPAVGTTSGMGIYRLIGSRILMDEKDINEYNRDNNGNIKLEKYTNDMERLIIHEDNTVGLSSYHHSIILEDVNRPNNFYAIYQDNRGNVILSDGGSGSDEDSIINQYYIIDKNGQLIAEKANEEYEITIRPEGIVLAGGDHSLNLIMKTPYKFNPDGDIYGSRVRIVDKNRIEFKVPQLTSKLPDGYKITVENPDTKKSTAKDLFYYYETVSLKPEITKVNPSVGSIEGGYQVLIEGKNFEDDSKVYIDGLLVAKGDVKREIISGQDTLIITKMPVYRRSMPDENTDRKIVPIVVENGNGGTALGRFTYVIPPSAKPIIDKVEFQKENQVGSAAGEEVLTISGRYFKFEEPWSLTRKYRDWIEGERNGTRVYFEDLDGDGHHTSYNNWIDYVEKGGDTKELPGPVETYDKYLNSEVLPTVRIGGIEAKIVEFGTNYIKVITPQITPGRHDLYVVNNDFGTSNRVNINFQGSKITIDKIVGDTGKKQGKDPVEIHGSGFQNTRMEVLENNNIKGQHMPKVRFGTIGGTKDINNNRAQITMENGDFTIEYDNSAISTAMVTMSGKYNKEVYKKTFTIDNYNGGPIYLPTWELKNINNKLYPGYELVKIEVKNRKLIVEKGYAPESKLINPSQISLKTPSYYTVGDVQVEVTNPDGGRGTSKYKYTNPASKPRITNITRDGRDPIEGDDGRTRILRMDYRGGQNIVVLGEDFREGARIQIGNLPGIENKDIIETLNASPNKLAFTMPEVSENAVGKLHRLTVINGDGAQASSDNPNNQWNAPIYIQFIKGESDPELGSIMPDKGPATGGTKVTIKGKDFRDKMEGYEGEALKIFFGGTEVPKGNIKIIDHSTIEVIAPKSDVFGPVRVKIENPDGSLSQENLIFTYISKPKIDDVDPKKIFMNDTKTEVTITGQQFQSGAKVIVGGKIIPIKDLKSGMDVKGQGITGVDPQGNNREVAIIGGMEASSVNVLGNGEIKVKFNEATDLENTSLIIINPDGGISDPYNEFKYEKPVPLKPMVLEGIPGYESTVMLIWNQSDPDLLNRATKYEIYGRLAKDSSSTFIGNTTGGEYLIKGLEANTEYVFMVRALNEYGAAIDFAEVKVRTLSIQEDYKEREKDKELKEEEKKLLEKGKEEIVGNKIIRTLGLNDFKNNVANIDFNQSKYKNTTELVINIPIALARKDSTLNIKYGELQMSINPKDMYTYRVSALDKGNKDSNLQINIKRQGESHIPRGKKLASRAYEFDFGFQVEKNTIEIDKLLRAGKLTLNFDNITYSNARNVMLYKYDKAKGEYIKTSNSRNTSFDNGGKYILLGNR